MNAVFGLARGTVRATVRAVVILLHILVRILPVVLVLAVIFASLTFSLISDVFASRSNEKRGRDAAEIAEYMEWIRYDVDITVNADGTLNVVEKPTVRFGTRTFSNGYREIPYNRRGTITDWSITDSEGHRYEAADAKGWYKYVVRQTSDGTEVNWYFEPVKNTTRGFEIGYRVHHALRYYEGGDQVWWKALYAGHEGWIEDGTLRVTVPEGASVHAIAAYIGEDLAGAGATAQLSEDERTVTYKLTKPLPPGVDFEVRVEFTPGVVAGEAPSWQAADDARVAAAEERARQLSVERLVAVVIALLIASAGAAGLFVLWYRHGRDKPMGIVAEALPEPPDDLPPGMAGTLLDEHADGEDILATIVDLARRGALRIHETNSSTAYAFQRCTSEVALRPYEEALLKALFGPELEREYVRSTVLGSEWRLQRLAVESDIYDAVVEEGYFAENPELVRGNYWYVGVAGILLAMVINVCLWIWTGHLLTASLPSIALVVVAVGMVLLSRHMPCKTPAGAEAAARWRAFKRYLTDLGKYADVGQYSAIWDRWLPYAIAFGVDKQYVAAFEAVEAPLPAWYVARNRSTWRDRGPDYFEWTVPRGSTASASRVGPSVSTDTVPTIGRAGGPKMSLSRLSHDFGGGFGNMSSDMGRGLFVATQGLGLDTLGPDLASGLGDGAKFAFYVFQIVGVFSGGGSGGGGGGGGGSGGFE